MAASKPEILLYQRADELATKLQRLYPCFRVFADARLSCIICNVTGSCFRLKIQDGTLSTSCNLPVIYSSVSGDCRLDGAEVFVVSVECIGKSNIAAAKPEIHILKIYIYKYVQRIVVAIQCCEIDRQQITSAATSLIR